MYKQLTKNQEDSIRRAARRFSIRLKKKGTNTFEFSLGFNKIGKGDLVDFPLNSFKGTITFFPFTNNIRVEGNFGSDSFQKLVKAYSTLEDFFHWCLKYQCKIFKPNVD